MKFLRFLGVFAVLFGLGFGVAHADTYYTFSLNDNGGSGGVVYGTSTSGVLKYGDEWGYFDTDKLWHKLTNISSLPTAAPNSHKHFAGYVVNDIVVITRNGQFADSYAGLNSFNANDTQLMAQWVNNKYKITLNDAGGSGGQVSADDSVQGLYEEYGVCYQILYLLQDLDLQNAACAQSIYQTPSRTGYNFKGYYSGQNGTGTQIVKENGDINYDAPNISTLFTTNSAIYAKWEPKIITVTLHKNDSTSGTTNGTPTPVYLKYATGWYSNSNATVSISQLTTNPERQGFTFNGYWTIRQSTGGTQVIDSDGNFLTTPAALTALAANGLVYARWTENVSPVYTVTLYPNNGSLGTSMQYIYVKNNVFYSDQAATNQITSNIFNSVANGGAGIPQPSISGQPFNGYYTSPSGGTRMIDSSGNIISGNTISNDQAWYAQYQATCDSIIALNPNGGQFSGTCGSEYRPQLSGNQWMTPTLDTGCIPERDGYVFAGYDYNGDLYYDDNLNIVTQHQVWNLCDQSSVTFNARWEPECNEIVFNDNNGQSIGANVNVTLRKKTGLPAWWGPSDPGSSYVCPKDSLPSAPVLAVPNAPAHASFLGYYTTNNNSDNNPNNQIFNSSGAVTTVGDNWTTNTNPTILYAHWECDSGYAWDATKHECKKQYAIRVQCNAGLTLSLGSLDYNEEGTYTNDTLVYDCKGTIDCGTNQHQEGWDTYLNDPATPSGGSPWTDSVTIIGGVSYNGANPITFVPHCVGDIYTIRYETNNGSFTNTSCPGGAAECPESYVAGVGATISARMQREGYTFDGWCDDSALTSNCSSNRTIGTDAVGNKTFYAKWTAACNKVTFVNNGANNNGSQPDLWKKTGDSRWYSNDKCGDVVSWRNGDPIDGTIKPTKTNAIFIGYSTADNNADDLVFEPVVLRNDRDTGANAEKRIKSTSYGWNWQISAPTSIYAHWVCDDLYHMNANGECVACEDGYYYNPDEGLCSPCPNETNDYFPNSTSPFNWSIDQCWRACDGTNGTTRKNCEVRDEGVSRCFRTPFFESDTYQIEFRGNAVGGYDTCRDDSLQYCPNGLTCIVVSSDSYYESNEATPVKFNYHHNNLDEYYIYGIVEHSNNQNTANMTLPVGWSAINGPAQNFVGDINAFRISYPVATAPKDDDWGARFAGYYNPDSINDTQYISPDSLGLTQPNASNIISGIGSSVFAPSASRILYAQLCADGYTWDSTNDTCVQNKYTITYKPNYTGASGSETERVTYGSRFTTKAANTFTRPGYRITAWGDDATTPSTNYPEPGTEYTYNTPSNIDLYALWQICPVNTYSYDGACEACPREYPLADVGSDEVTDCYHNCETPCVNPVTCPIANATCYYGTNPNQGRWYQGEDSCDAPALTCPVTSFECDQGYTPNITNDECVAKTYDVVYECGTGTGGPTTDTHQATYGATYNVLNVGETDCTNSGHNFLGWKYLDGNMYRPGNMTWTHTDDHPTFTAQWGDANTYTITYKPNYTGATQSDETQVVTYNQSFTTKGVIFTRPGHIMIGWSEPFPLLSHGYTYNVADNTTLNAQWQECPDGQTPNANGTACVPCPEGQYSVNGICMPCPDGTQPNATGDGCEPCPDGYVSNQAATTCTPCAAGTYAVDNMCEPCPDGYVSNQAATTCTPCAAGTYAVDNTCEPCEDGYDSPAGSSSPNDCFLSECPAGQHIDHGACYDDVIDCDAPYARIAKRTWNGTLRAYRSCQIQECDDGYHIASNACVPNEQSCVVANGYGETEWNGTGWGTCENIQCDPGFELNSNGTACVRCSNYMGTDDQPAVSSYVSECEIATCMYQGQKYVLDNNECRRICDRESDGTGTESWDETLKKCVRTCNPGYKMW